MLMLIFVIIVMMVVMMLVLIFVIIVMMVVVMMLVLIFVIIVVVMVVMMLMLIFVIIVVVMVVVMLVLVLVVVMVVMVLMLIFIVVVMLFHDFREDLGLQISLSFDRSEDLFAVKFRDRGCDDGSLVVVLTKEFYTLRDLGVAHLIGSCENDGARVFDLIDKELTEVLDVDLALGGVYNCNSAVEFHIGAFCGILDRFHNIRELADAGGLDEDPLRRVGVHHFSEGCAEISNQGAADAAGVHLTDLNAGLLEETAVNTDLAEFVLDQDNACSRERVLEELFDQCSLSGSEKTGNNINFRHSIASFPKQNDSINTGSGNRIRTSKEISRAVSRVMS